MTPTFDKAVSAKPIEDGGLAFPFSYQGPTTGPEVYYGLSMRDWFAGLALQGLITEHLQAGNELRTTTNTDAKCAALAAYVFADAMLAARAKPKAV